MHFQRIDKDPISGVADVEEAVDGRTVKNPVNSVEMKPGNSILMSLDLLDDLVVKVVIPGNKLEYLDTSI